MKNIDYSVTEFVLYCALLGFDYMFLSMSFGICLIVKLITNVSLSWTQIEGYKEFLLQL